MSRPHIRCIECDRVQGIAPAGVGGGVTEVEAQSFGWKRDDNGWHCPFCTGNEDKLREIFVGK